jgi:hypothetical protein
MIYSFFDGPRIPSMIKDFVKAEQRVDEDFISEIFLASEEE